MPTSLNEILRSSHVLPAAYDGNDFLALTRALLAWAGVEGYDDSPGVSSLRAQCEGYDHVVFVLIDGMGVNLLQRLPPDAFLRVHTRLHLQSIMLSTTACALTTLATAECPARHGVPGWWTFLAERGINAVTLPFEERATGRPLTEFGVEPSQLYPVPSVWPRATRVLTSVVPSGIAGSVYSDYASGGTPRVGYEQFKQLPARVAQVISQAGGPSLTYCYVPDLDGAVHETGTQSDKTLAVLHAVNRTCEQMAEMVRGRARLVIGADHGLADVPANRRTILGADDALSRFLRTAPTGEPTVPIFHVRAGAEAAFRAEFEERFCEFFALATPDEVEASRVLGPCPLTDTMRRRLGTFMGFAEIPAKFYINPSPQSHPEYIGVHGGMSRNEVEIPLIIV